MVEPVPNVCCQIGTLKMYMVTILKQITAEFFIGRNVHIHFLSAELSEVLSHLWIFNNIYT